MPVAASVRRAYVTGPYGQVHLYMAGDIRTRTARPIVCFHQSPLSGRTFDALMRELARDRYMLAPDTPGYGQSDGPLKQLSIADYADAHAVVIDAMDLGEIDVLGVHTGSRIAVEFARQHRNQVKNVILVGAAVYTDEERTHQREWTSDGLAPTENSDGSHLRKIWDNWAQYRGPGVTDAMIERYVSDTLRQRDTAGFAIHAVFNHDMGHALADLEQPTLVLNVRDDIYEATKRSGQVMKSGRVIDLSPTGLWPLETRTEEIAAAIRLFCKG